MRGAIVLILCFPVLLNAQNLWNVSVGGGGTSGIDPFYNPQFLSIEAGDTVRWNNTYGTHNVDGRIETYPGNPASFYSGEPSQGWTYSFVFDSIGAYGFQCNQGDHAQTQWGIITVSPVNSVLEISNDAFTVSPNPVINVLQVKGERAIERIEILDMNGKNVFIKEISDMTFDLNISQFNSGVYFIRIYSGGTVQRTKIIKN